MDIDQKEQQYQQAMINSASIKNTIEEEDKEVFDLILQSYEQGSSLYASVIEGEEEMVPLQMSSQSQSSSIYLQEDFNQDGYIDGLDLGILLGAWNTTNPDVDQNGTEPVDGLDLGILLGAWHPPGEGVNPIFARVTQEEIFANLVGAEILHREDEQTVEGDELSNILVGSDAKDVLIGNEGDDLLIGHEGNNDDLQGGAGNDVLFADSYLMGDFNGDNVVDAVDTGIWQANQNQTDYIYLDTDYNQDGYIDGLDLGILLGAWNPPESGGTTNPDMDLNSDGFVDGLDLGMFLGTWHPPAEGVDPVYAGNKYIPGDTNFDGTVDALDQPIEGVTIADMNNDVPSNARDVLRGGDGHDFLYAGMGFDHLWGGDGADTFIATEVQFFLSGATFVRDFDPTEGDVLDISNIISGYDPMEDMLSDFISLQDRAGTTNIVDLYVNSDGTGGDLGFATVEITGMSGYGSGASEAQLQDLVDNGIFIV